MVNSVINDMLVLSKRVIKNNGNYLYHYECKCIKCGRTHSINGSVLREGGLHTTHRRCNNAIDRKQPHFKRFYAIYADTDGFYAKYKKE